VGHDVYVFLIIDSQLVCYTDPNNQCVQENKPQLVGYLRDPQVQANTTLTTTSAGSRRVPLFLCDYPVYGKKSTVAGCLAGKVLEQR
jgi:hypothetical protein